MKYLPILLAVTISLGTASVAFATDKPRSTATDNRIMVVPYEQDNVVPIQATTFVTTQIVFGNNEYILNVENGDMDAWSIDVRKQVPYMLFIKPTILGSNTNMTVITNKHTYYFHLTSNKPTGGNSTTKQTYAVQFIYPEEVKAKLATELAIQEQQRKALLSAPKHPSDYNWDYSFSGNKRIVPMHVFDDGRFTYMQLQPGQPVPAIFAVNNTKGEESVINYRRDGQFLVIQEIAPQFTLRDGKHLVASIFNNKLITTIKHNRS